jgi:oxaloacetate decarboxylase alpha subunit
VGFPPLVTPMSQIVGTQAVLNVLSGKRWHIVPDEMKAYLRGRYGSAPGPLSPEIVERVLGDEQPIHVRPGALLTETLDGYAEEIGDLARSEEDVLSYALFPQTARTYLEKHHLGPESDVFGIREIQYLSAQIQTAVSSGAEDRVREILSMVEASSVDEVVIEEGDLRVTVKKALPEALLQAGAAALAAVPGPGAAAPSVDDSNGYHAVRSPMVATFYRSPSPSAPPFVEVGDTVAVGQTLCILEAMKLMNELSAEVDGVIHEIVVDNGQPVEYGQVLFTIEPF